MAEALNGSKRISHTIDDIETNIMTTKTIFRVANSGVTGNINVILWNEWDSTKTISDAVLMDAQKADECNLVIKKIYDTDTTISQTDFFLLK